MGTNFDDFFDLSLQTDAALGSLIRRLTRDLWMEDHITLSIVQMLRDRLHGAEIKRRGYPVHLAVNAFKATGALETKYGDLAIIVQLDFGDEAGLEGVAFLEAKKREWGSNKLAAIQKGQFKRLQRSAHYTRLLVYDKDPISGAAMGANDEWMRLGLWRRFYGEIPAEAAHRLPHTHAAVVPLGIPIHAGRTDTWLYRFALPFAAQLGLRYLQGIDLETETKVLAAAKGRSEKLGVPSFVLTVRAGHGVPGDPDQPHDFGIDGDNLEELQIRG
ncbi:MAG: hypothetical protein H6719_23105 [Sandaracinaceae bacterium]|nr:hypothetical protein [Sandaracinaceae bacterium]